MNSFTDILQEFYVGFKQRCILFWNFENTYFIESLSITPNLMIQVQRYYALTCTMEFYMRVETAERPIKPHKKRIGF